MIFPSEQPGGPTLTTEQRGESTQQSLKRVIGRFWGSFEPVDRLFKVIGVAATVVTVIVFLESGRDYDFDIWTEKVQPVYPSDATNDMMLPLSVGDVSAKSVTFIKLDVSNPGKESIGLQSQPWTLTLTGPQETNMVVLGLSRGGSSKTKATVNANPMTNKVSFQIGLLQPHDYLEVNLIILNAADPRYPKLTASTSLLGLQDPIVNSESPVTRAAEKTIWVFVGISCLALLSGVYWDVRHKQGDELKKYFGQLFRPAPIIGLVVIVFALSWFLSYGTAWLVIQSQKFG
jgi:hypothetical protein